MPLSAILRELAGDVQRPRVSVADLLHALSDRALAALMFVFAFPNAFPMPPGTSAVLGAPLVFLAAQLMLGKEAWLPRAIGNRSMPRGAFQAIVSRMSPWLERFERLLRPRLVVLAAPPAEYVVGFVTLVMAIILVLPIPFGNIPPAISMAMLALGVLERDGVWITLGLVVAGIALFMAWGVLYGLLQAALYVLSGLLG